MSLLERLGFRARVRADAPVVDIADEDAPVGTDQDASAEGMQNKRTGMGGEADKSGGISYIPRRFSRRQLEAIYHNSWSAARFIDLLPNDMVTRGRQWRSDDEGLIQTIEEAETQLHVLNRVGRAMKLGRLMGTSMVVMMIDGQDMADPLEINRVREGQLTNLLVVDRFDTNPVAWVRHPYDPQYGFPDIYDVRLIDGTRLQTHASRVVRFEGRESLSSNGWQINAQRDWGVSELAYAIDAINQQHSTASGVNHLVQEASVFVMKVQGYNDLIRGVQGSSEASLEQRVSLVNRLKSIYRTLVADPNDDVERISVQFGGLYQLLEMYTLLLASIAGVPATRWLGRSPAGLNSTGEGDERNYAIDLLSFQRTNLTPQIRPLDAVIARNIGTAEPVEYDWLPITEISEKDRAETSRTRAQAVSLASPYLLDGEARAALSGDELFGELEPGALDALADDDDPDGGDPDEPEDGGNGDA